MMLQTALLEQFKSKLIALKAKVSIESVFLMTFHDGIDNWYIHDRLIKNATSQKDR
jgi:hypothetical protein